MVTPETSAAHQREFGTSSAENPNGPNLFACTIDESAGQRDKALLEVTEKQWQAQVKEMAELMGWRRSYHTFDSRRSTSGFPDLVLIRDRVLFVELKREAGKLQDEQRGWLRALLHAGAEAYVARPHDFDALAAVLRARKRIQSDLEAATCRELGLPP